MEFWRLLILGWNLVATSRSLDHTYGASDILRRSLASRRISPSRCKADRLCTAARWRCRSSRSSTWCRRSRGRRCRIASRSGRSRSADSPGVYHRNSSPATDNRSPRWRRDACRRTRGRSDNRRAQDGRSRTPSSDRSSRCRPPLATSSGKGPPAAAFGPASLQVQKLKRLLTLLRRATAFVPRITLDTIHIRETVLLRKIRMADLHLLLEWLTFGESRISSEI